jgi:hypothetical protein
MIEKKDPHQKIFQDDLSDDDPIIELTEEVVLTDKDRKAQTRKSDDFLSAKAAEDQALENDEDITAFEENEKVDWHRDLFSETDHQAIDDGQDGVDENYAEAVEDDAAEMTGDQKPRDFEDETEFGYDNDSDEFDLSAMDGYAEDEGGIDIIEAGDFDLDEDEEDAAPLEELIETPEDDLISLADFEDDDDEIEEDITEITEFDRHFSEDEEDILAHAGMLDPSGLGDEDFLELFELEDESPTESEEMRDLSESEEKAVEAEINRLLDDTLEDETLFEKNDRRHAEESSGLDSGSSPDTLANQSERFDRTARLFAEGAETDYGPPLLFRDHPEDDEPPAEDSRGSRKGESQSLAAEQIDMAIERVINEKFADRIEQIIYEIIEKTVLKEIERLKGALLEDGADDDDI